MRIRASRRLPRRARRTRFWSDSREHRIYRVALGYAVGAWIIRVVAAIVLPGFAAPPWMLRALMILLAPGFGAALLAGWGYDRRTAGRPLMPRAPQGRLAWVLTAILPAALVMLFFLLRPLPRPVAAIPPPAVAAAPAPTVLTPSAAAPEKLVAVLPFENLSADKDNAFFADGVQDAVQPGPNIHAASCTSGSLANPEASSLCHSASSISISGGRPTLQSGTSIRDGHPAAASGAGANDFSSRWDGWDGPSSSF